MEQISEFLKHFVEPYLTISQLRYVEFVTSKTAHEFFLDKENGAGYIGVFYSDVPINAYDLVFIDGPVNHFRMKATLPDSTQVAERGKTFSADYLNVLRTAEHAIPVLIDQRLDTRWKIMELVHGGLKECYYYGAMKFEITASPENVATLERLPIRVIDKGESLNLPVEQNPPP